MHAYDNVGPQRMLSCADMMQLLCIKPAWPGVCAFPTAAQVPALTIVCLAAYIYTNKYVYAVQTVAERLFRSVARYLEK